MEDKSEQDKIKNKQEEKALNQNRKEIEQDKAPSENNKLEQDIIPSVLKQQANWDALFFYQKSDVIYQLTFAFCDRFIHLYKDRTRDQVIQAARSCKQNIVEGLADGVTSTEMQLKLLNVARASLKETREDFEDYLKSASYYSIAKEKTDTTRCSATAVITISLKTTSHSSLNGAMKRCATAPSPSAIWLIRC